MPLSDIKTCLSLEFFFKCNKRKTEISVLGLPGRLDAAIHGPLSLSLYMHSSVLSLGPYYDDTFKFDRQF